MRVRHDNPLTSPDEAGTAFRAPCKHHHVHFILSGVRDWQVRCYNLQPDHVHVVAHSLREAAHDILLGIIMPGSLSMMNLPWCNENRCAHIERKVN